MITSIGLAQSDQEQLSESHQRKVSNYEAYVLGKEEMRTRFFNYIFMVEVGVLHDGGEDPAAVGQDVGEEEVGVDLVPQAPHLPS